MKRILAALLLPFAAGAAELPVRAVTLSNAGLMQVERAGRLGADEPATLTIPTGQVDDVLKSLLVLDAAGTVLGVSLPAQNLEEEAFRGLPLRPEDFQNRLTMLAALRGQSVELGGTTGLLLDVTEGENALRVMILSDRGLAQLMLREGDTLRLIDADLAARVARAAAALAASRSAESRRAEIRFSATAAREVALAYVTAAPLWKASFRLVLGETDGRLQGWAVVENRSGADWSGVRLSLVSGNPVAYAQALYTPILRARPEVPVRGAEVVRPQTDSAPRPMAMAAPSAPASGAMDAVGRGRGGAVAAAAPPLAALPAPLPLPQATAESTAGSVSYALPNPVSLRASETANLPFLDATLPAERVWWVQGLGVRHPLNAARIRNATGGTLPDGLVAVYAGGAFLGDAELRALNDGDTRLLAFAQDRDVALDSTRQTTSRTQRIGAVRGVVIVEGEEESTLSIAIAPRGGRGPLIIDMPRQQGWTPRFSVVAEGDFGLRHETRLDGVDTTLRLVSARPMLVETPLWDPGLGAPNVYTWRTVNVETERFRLPGGPGTLERLSELLARTGADVPGRPILAAIVRDMAELRRLLDLARGAVREATVADAALTRARAATDDRTGAERDEARRALNRASQVAERTAAAADTAWRVWLDAVQELLTRAG